MSDLRRDLNFFGASREHLTMQAFACYSRGVLDVRLRRVRFGVLELTPDADPQPTTARVLSWPGAAAFPGVARVELPARDGLAPELPIGFERTGSIVLALPVLERALDGPIDAVDIVWCHPLEPQKWARATGLAVFLGRPPVLQQLTDADPVRLHATPLSWFRALAREPLTAGCCLLDTEGLEAERLLLGPPLICDDADHAAAVHGLQKAMRERLRKRLPKPGDLLVAKVAA